MPSSTAFTLPDPTDSHAMEDSLLDESDLEDLYEVHHPRSSSSIDYWYGKKLFTIILAEDLVQNAASIQSGDDLDAALMMMTTEFPYQDRTRQMAQILPLTRHSAREENPPTDFQSFVTHLGKLYRLSDTETKMRIAAVVKIGDDDIEARHPDSNGSHHHPGVMNEHNDPAVGSMSEDDNDIELARYTVALKEYADHTRSIVRWEDRQMSLLPPCWRVTANVKGISYRASAGNKKQAKHLASRLACRNLHLEV